MRRFRETYITDNPETNAISRAINHMDGVTPYKTSTSNLPNDGYWDNPYARPLPPDTGFKWDDPYANLPDDKVFHWEDLPDDSGADLDIDELPDDSGTDLDIDELPDDSGTGLDVDEFPDDSGAGLDVDEFPDDSGAGLEFPDTSEGRFQEVLYHLGKHLED